MINGEQDKGGASDAQATDRPLSHEDFDGPPTQTSWFWLAVVAGLGLLSAVSVIWSILSVIGIA